MNYYGIWKSFSDFFLRLDDKPCTWDQHLTLFIGYLIDQHRKSTTIKRYISAIKSVLWDDGIEINDNQMLWTSLTRACRIHNDTIQTKFPIKRGLLNMLVTSLDKFYQLNQQPYLVHMYKVLLCMAYFGLFRIGELTSSEHIVKAKDVHIGLNKKKLLFVLHSSKMHDKGSKPQIIKIQAKTSKNCQHSKLHKECYICVTADRICPFQSLQNYLAVRKSRKGTNEQFFVFKDRSPVLQHHFRTILCKLLKFNNFNPQLYSSSGFRSGRASDLLNMGVSIETIKKLGRWKSNAIFKYLRA